MISNRTKENIGIFVFFLTIGVLIALVLHFSKGLRAGQKVYIKGESAPGEIVKKASEETYYLVRVTRGQTTTDLVFPASQLSTKPLP
jgi:hypothetical protein